MTFQRPRTHYRCTGRLWAVDAHHTPSTVGRYLHGLHKFTPHYSTVHTSLTLMKEHYSMSSGTRRVRATLHVYDTSRALGTT